MADIKFSALTDGGASQDGDSYPAIRAGANVKIFNVPGGYGTLIAFNTAITAEKARITGGNPRWQDGTPFRVATEKASRAVRIWDATAQHARTIRFGAVGRVLASDTNTVLSTTGIPASGTGADGDFAVDWTTGAYYLKTSGAWAVSSVDGFNGGTAIGASVTVSRSLAAADNQTLTPIGADGLLLTVPLGLTTGFSALFPLCGATGLTSCTLGFTFPSGVTVNGVAGPGTLYRSSAGNAVVSLTYIAANVFALSGGDVAAPSDTDMTAFNSRVTTAGGTTSTGTKAAVLAFITGLKADGLWSLLDDIWVPVGDFAASVVKIKNTANVIFVGIVSGDYAENLGVKGDGTIAKYVRRQYNPKHIGGFYQYLRTTQASSTTSRTGLGGADATNHFTLGYNTTATGGAAATSIRGKVGGLFATSSPAAFNGNAAGGYGATRRTNTDAELTYNATSLNTSATSTTGADSTVEAFELLRNANATPDQPMDANTYTGGSAYWNTGATQAQMFAFHARMATLQTALGRNV